MSLGHVGVPPDLHLVKFLRCSSVVFHAISRPLRAYQRLYIIRILIHVGNS